METNKEGYLDLPHNTYYVDYKYLEGQAQLAERARRISSLKRFSLKEEAIKIGYIW
jgi:hypothetical protein